MIIIKKGIFKKRYRSFIFVVFVFFITASLLPSVNSYISNINHINEFYIEGLKIYGNIISGPDIETEGNLQWSRVKPGATVTGSFIVKNVGDPGSELDWRISEYPSWGEWTFAPKSGVDLKPEDGKLTVQVTVVAPDEEANFTGRVKVIETNGDDYNFVLVSLSTPKVKVIEDEFKININNYFFYKWFINKISNIKI